MLAILRKLFGFTRFVLRRWSEDRCPQIAGSLTYTTLLALVPAFMIAVAVLSSAPFFENVMTQFKIFLLLNLLPEIAGTIITVYMEQFTRNAARLTTIGIAVLFAMAIMLMFTIDRSINAIWRVGHSRPYWISAIGYGVLLVLAPLLIGLSMSLTTYLMAISIRYASVPPEAESILIRAIPASMSAVAFFLLYRIVPHRKVPWRHALVGGVVAAILFEIAKELFAFYVRRAPAYNLIYGTFALVPIFLIWVYISWLMVLFGAELTASLEFWAGSRFKRTLTTQARFAEVVAIGRRLVEAGGEPLTVERLRLDTGMPRRDLEAAIQRLEKEGWLKRDGEVVALALDPHEITLGNLYEASMGEAPEPIRKG
jgi:membrane protein